MLIYNSNVLLKYHCKMYNVRKLIFNRDKFLLMRLMA